jgi:NAD(P)-dependent dehydrogenase (short-subunit alcohol dehydrogenase family)
VSDSVTWSAPAARGAGPGSSPSPTRCCPCCEGRGQPRIVNLTSDLGSLARASSDPAFPQLLAYNSSKAALNAVTVTYANELRDQGILVNAVSPGSVATDQNGHQGVLTPDQGAKLPIRMATLPAGGPTGTAVTADTNLTPHPLPW